MNSALEVPVKPAVLAAVVNVVGVPAPGGPTPGSPVEILPPAFVADAPPPSDGGVGASSGPSDAGPDSGDPDNSGNPLAGVDVDVAATDLLGFLDGTCEGEGG